MKPPIPSDTEQAKPVKPLGRKAYGSIPHLPGSRLGPGDHHCHVGQDAICQTKMRDKHDRIIVTEKLDGGNVAIANVGGVIHALGRAGYPALTSRFVQHHHFDTWVNRLNGLWTAMLAPGEVLHGEWLAQAHGTIYKLEHDPFVAFDLTRGGKRVPHDEMVDRCRLHSIPTPYVLSDGPAITLADALERLGEYGHHGATDPVEGVVYRVERKGQFDFLAKFVRPDKADGKYLPEISGADPRWHWLPAPKGAAA
jgi:hypothetical protein